MKNYKTKAEKFNEVFRLMDGFKTMGTYYLPSNKQNVYDCLTEDEKELYNLFWNENFHINRERLNYSFSKGNDKKYDKLIEEAFNLLEKAFKEYISDNEGNISLCNRAEYSLKEKLEKINLLKESFNKTPEYSDEFYNIGVDIEIPGVGIVKKTEPKLSEDGYITNRTGCFEFVLRDNFSLEEGLYIFPEFDNLRFDLSEKGYIDKELTLCINIDTELQKEFVGLMKQYIDDFETQLMEYNIPHEDIRYSKYDVYSKKELL